MKENWGTLPQATLHSTREEDCARAAMVPHIKRADLACKRVRRVFPDAPHSGHPVDWMSVSHDVQMIVNCYRLISNRMSPSISPVYPKISKN